MIQDASIIETRHKMFVNRVVQFNTVWVLESDEGVANSTANDDDDIDVILFWSDRAYSKAVAKDDWENYRPTEMTLAAFLEKWVVGMSKDNILVGTNWDANMFGKEIHPLRLALEIVDELRLKSKNIDFDKFSDLTDYETQIKNTLNSD
jgi:hypothetical protein